MFAFVDVDASDLSGRPDAMHEMFERRLDVMIVRNVFSPAQAKAVVDRLERPDAGYPFLENRQSDDQSSPYNLGQVLIPSRTYPHGTPHEVYFPAAAEFRRTCASLFQGGLDFETRLEEILRGISGGRRVGVAHGPDGQPYTPATIRAIPRGAGYALHAGNHFKDHDAYRHLRALVDLEDQLSYFVTLAVPEGGGEIEVFRAEWHVRPRTSRGDLDLEAIMRDAPSTKYKPGPGDMFVFDGGRWYHRVCEVVGAKTRWTIGGFVTISKDHRDYFYWS